jgi:hypothetical protein
MKSNKILTCINLNFGHNHSWAILLGTKVLDQGNRYDHGPINESEINTLAKKHKAQINWIRTEEKVPEEQRAALRQEDSDWDDTFPVDEIN